MKQENELTELRNSIFMLICQLESNLADSLSKNKADPFIIAALTKLVDSFLKVYNAGAGNSCQKTSIDLLEEDKALLEMWLLGPDSNQRPSG